MRIFTASLATETNTFAPFPTGWAAYREFGLARGSAIAAGPLSEPLRVFRRLATGDGHQVVESLCAHATPSGPTVREVYESLRDTILDDLRAAAPVDIVLLMLHGAMVAEGYQDCEGDLIGRAKAIAPDAVIGVELDPHCHLTSEMVTRSDVVVIGREYPHIDFADRAADLYRLCIARRQGVISLEPALLDLRLIGFFPTLEPPMSDVVSAFRNAEHGGIHSTSLAHGFPWADTADVGARVLVYAETQGEAVDCANVLGGGMYRLRTALRPEYPSIDEALDRALSADGLTVLGDFADNPGGGAPGDSTYFLQALLARGFSSAALGAIWDPFVAQLCADAGVGARLRVRLGGKSGVASGSPLDLGVEVKAIRKDHAQTAFGAVQPLGLTVWLAAGEIDIVVSSIRTQVFEPSVFTGLGIPLDERRLVVVKSSNHYVAGFKAMADQISHVQGPGAMSLDFAALPYTRRDLNYYPRCDDPWSAGGGPRLLLPPA